MKYDYVHLPDGQYWVAKVKLFKWEFLIIRKGK